MNPDSVAWPLVVFVLVELVFTIAGCTYYEMAKSELAKSIGYDLARVGFSTLTMAATPALFVLWTLGYWQTTFMAFSIAKLVAASAIFALGALFYVRTPPALDQKEATWTS